MAKSSSSAPLRSPWAGLKGVLRASMKPAARPVEARLRVAGSKSFTNRGLILAAFSQGPSELRGILRSDDSYWCVEALRRLGVTIEVDDDTAHVGGLPPGSMGAVDDLFVGSAGTTARFLPGLLAATLGGPWHMDGSAQLRRRPLGPLVTALRDLGGDITALGAGAVTAEAPENLPLRIGGRGLAGGEVAIAGDVSSQFISGVLMAAPRAQKPVTLQVTTPIVQQAYVMMTVDIMAAFGVKVTHDEALTTFHVTPQAYQGQSLDLEADASTAGYFFALAAVTAGRVEITNLAHDTRQPDIALLDVLARMGCEVERHAHGISVQGPAVLRGGLDVSMREMSDQTLTVAALAPFADGPVTLRDVEHIRHHECDRIRAMCASMQRLGIEVEEFADGLTVHPGTPEGCLLPSYDDHRVAMALSIVGARVPGVEIEDPGCVSKTCPNYFELIHDLGIDVTLHTKDDP